MDEPLATNDHLGGAGGAVEANEAGGEGMRRSFSFAPDASGARCGDQECFGEVGPLAATYGLLSVSELQRQDVITVVWNGAVLTLLYLVVGGVWLMLSDAWSLTDTVYFVTTSLLTIGYGDIVVKDGTKDRVLDTLLILLGLISVTIWASCATQALHTIRSSRAEGEEAVPVFNAGLEIQRYRWRLSYRFAVIVVVLMVGVLVFMAGENVEFPESFYWAVVTASTIGYGDVVPTTAPMRWFTTFFSIVATVSMLETLRFAGAYPFMIWKFKAEARVFEQFTKAATASERDAAAALVDTAVTQVLGIPPEARPGGTVGRSEATLAMLLLLNRVSYDDVQQAARIFDTLGNGRDNAATAAAAAAVVPVLTSAEPKKN